MPENLKSEIAAAQKARARFGNFFTKENYAAMANCKTVSDVASMIRENPSYSDMMSVLNDEQLSRGYLEKVFKSRMYTDFSELFGFDYALGSKLYRLVVIDCEIDLIMTFACRLNSGTAGQYLPELPEFLEKHLDLDLLILRESKNFEGLIRSIKKKDILQIVSICRPKDDEPIDLSFLEYLMMSYFYKMVVEIADDDKKITDIFGMKADFANLQMIIRQKKYFEADADTIKNRLLPLGHYFTQKKLKMLCDASVEEIFEFLSTTPYKNYFDRHNDTIVIAGNRVIHDICRKTMRFETSPSAVLSAYILLAKNQFDCLTTIIEGVRYFLPSKNIMELLPI